MNLHRLALAWAVAGLTLLAALIAASFVSAAPVAPTWALIPVFVAVFPLHLYVIAQVRGTSRGHRLPLSRLRNIPVPVRVATIAAAVAMLAACLTGMAPIGGQPVHDASSYYLTSHGRRTPVNAKEYAHAEALQERAFSGALGVFYALAVGGCFV